MIDRIALLIGLFAAPVIALRLGNRFRDQSTTHRRVFWGLVIGHTCGLLLAVSAAMLPPIAWEEGPRLRDALVHWSMFGGSVIGALAGWVTRDRTPPAPPATRAPAPGRVGPPALPE